MTRIVWSSLARETYLGILEYLIENFSVRIAIEFEKKVDKILSNIEKFNAICPASTSNPTFRKCVITKQTSLIYKIDGDTIGLVTFLDNRTNHKFV